MQNQGGSKLQEGMGGFRLASKELGQRNSRILINCLKLFNPTPKTYTISQPIEAFSIRQVLVKLGALDCSSMPPLHLLWAI
jgi:hypothetical protein